MKQHARIQLAIVVALPLLVFAESAFAGGTGGAFIAALNTFMIDSLKGYVGTAIGVAGLLYGLVAGIVKGSLIGLGTASACPLAPITARRDSGLGQRDSGRFLTWPGALVVV